MYILTPELSVHCLYRSYGPVNVEFKRCFYTVVVLCFSEYDVSLKVESHTP